MLLMVSEKGQVSRAFGLFEARGFESQIKYS